MKNKKLVVFCAITPILVTVVSLLISGLCFYSFMYLLREELSNFYRLYLAGFSALSVTTFGLGLFLYHIFLNLNDKVRNDKTLSSYSFFINIPTAAILLLLTEIGGGSWLILIFSIPFILLQTLVYKKFRKLVEAGYFENKK